MRTTLNIEEKLLPRAEKLTGICEKTSLVRLGLEARILKIVSSWKNTDSKKMFGGICHLLNGNMFCGVYKEFLILRLGEEKAGEALKLPFAKPFDITGKPMKGWVMVEVRGFAGDEELKEWLEKAKAFVKTLGSK